MKKNYSGIRKYEVNEKNPFIHETFVHVDKGDKLISMGFGNPLVDKDTGEVVGHPMMLKRKKVDRAQFRKIYISTLSSWFDLNKTGIRVLSYIITVLKPNKDYIDFNLKDCLEFTGYAQRNSVLNGISELLKQKFIARAEHPYKYYINPTLLFNGDRLTLIQQYKVDIETEIRADKESLNEAEKYLLDEDASQAT